MGEGLTIEEVQRRGGVGHQEELSKAERSGLLASCEPKRISGAHLESENRATLELSKKRFAGLHRVLRSHVLRSPSFSTLIATDLSCSL